MQSYATADFDANVGRGDVLRETVGFRDGSLALADGIHSRTKVHAPNGLGAEFSNEEL